MSDYSDTNAGAQVERQRERIKALEEALEALSGSPKDMRAYCIAHNLDTVPPDPDEFGFRIGPNAWWRKQICFHVLTLDRQQAGGSDESD